MNPRFFQLRTIFLFWVFPPFFFIAAILLIAGFAGYILNLDTNLEAYIARRLPHIILMAQVLLLLWAMLFHKNHGEPLLRIGYYQVSAHKRGRQAILGFSLGFLLLMVYLFIIHPAQFWLQLHIGDMVPHGNMLNDIKTDGLLFIIANLLLAPLVEENVFRGFALRSLAARQNILIAIIWSSVAFGLFHWIGGFWYMLMTAVVVGIPFAIIALRRGNIFMVFIAHLVLNAGLLLYAFLLM